MALPLVNLRSASIARGRLHRKRSLLRVLTPTLAAAGLLLGVAPAHALVTPLAAPQFGVEPHSTALFHEPKRPLAYHGGPVMSSNATYAVYWDPTQTVSWNYDGDWRALIDEYFQAVGQDSSHLGNAYALTSQYSDSSGHRAAYNSTFRGAYTDTTAYPTSGCTDPAPEPEKVSCLTDAQLRVELSSFISAHGLKTGIGTIFFLFTPPGVTVCTDAGTTPAGHCSDSSAAPASYEHSFCSYHSYMGTETNPTIYAVQPWTAGNLGMYLPLSGTLGKASGSDCQDGSGAQQEPNQLSQPDQEGSIGLDSDGDFDAGLADVIANEISVEQVATITDPLLNGWYAPVGQANEGNEVPDQCRNFFASVPTEGKNTPPEHSLTGAGTLSNQSLGAHHYYLNDEFNQAALSMDYPGIPCLTHVNLAPRFTAPNPINAGEIVGLDAGESNITLDAGFAFKSKTEPYEPYETFPTYTWSFGDGASTASAYPPGAAQTDEPSVFHSYQYGGAYQVTLTVTDVGGNTATTSQAITVVGPPPPPAAAGKAAASVGTIAGSSTGSSVGSLPPSFTESPLSHSLKKATRLGLAIHYNVSEQVAGRAEALLDSATASRLGIKGATATGLPKGYPRQVIVGNAVLVTTRAGQGTVRIKFSKTIATRLAKAHQVKLTLRFVLRSISGGVTHTTTTLSAVTLSH